MKVISKYRDDYYDGAAALSDQNSVVFRRNNGSLLIADLPENLQKIIIDSKKVGCEYVKSRAFMMMTGVLVFFCGKVYRGVRVVRTSLDKRKNIEEMEDQVFYNLEDTEAYLAKYSFNLATRDSFFLCGVKSRKSFEKFLADQGTSEFYDFCHEQKIVIGTFECNTEFDRRVREIATNGRLRRYNFDRVKPAKEAISEMEAYIGGVLSTKFVKPEIVDPMKEIRENGFNMNSFARYRK